MEVSALLDQWKSFFPATSDEVQLRRQLLASLNKLEDLKFVRKVGTNDESWEVRKLLKARLPLDVLEDLRSRLMRAEAE